MPEIIIPPDQSQLVRLFLAVHIVGGQIGLPILVATFLLAKNVYRHPTLINFCITWIIFSVTFCLLQYSGTVHNDPPSTACFIQAIMVEGSPPMAGLAGLLVVVQIWRTLQPNETKIPRLLDTTLNLGLPYFTFSVFALVAAVYEKKYPEAVVSRNGLYCTLGLKAFFFYTGPIFCLVMLALILIIETATVVQLYQLKKMIHKVFPLASQRPSPSLVIRIGIFTLYCWLVLVACILFVSSSSSHWGYMIEASIPLAVVVVFGTQKDLLLVWCCLKPRKGDRVCPLTERAHPIHTETSGAYTPTIPSIRFPTSPVNSNEEV